MALSLYATRALVMQIAVMYGVPQYFRTTFFGEDDESNSDVVDIEVIKGGRTIAPFVSPRMGGKVMKRSGQTLKTYRPVPVKPILESFAEDILQNAGGAFYAKDESPEDRAQKSLLKDLNDGVDMVDRRIEVMCSEFMQTGIITCKGEGVDDEIDFQADADHFGVLVGDALFTDDTSNPIDFINAKCEAIFKKSGIRPTRVTFGLDAWAGFKNNPNVKDELDKRRINSGEINPERLEEGVSYMGYLTEANVEIYTYSNYYTDPDSGDTVSIFPSNGMSLASPQAGGKVAWAAIADFAIVEDLGGIFVGRVFVDSERKKNPSRRELYFQGRPLPLPGNVDAYGYWEVV